VETNRTSHAVDHYKRKDALAAVSFVASENIFSAHCNGIGSCTAQPPFLSGRKPVRMRHMKEKFTRKIFPLWLEFIYLRWRYVQ
jgi:truncated hemoglobin YjbI